MRKFRPFFEIPCGFKQLNFSRADLKDVITQIEGVVDGRNSLTTALALFLNGVITNHVT